MKIEYIIFSARRISLPGTDFMKEAYAKMKKVISVLLTLGVLCVLAACGASEPAETTIETTTDRKSVV